jgi:hypothetical protein
MAYYFYLQIDAIITSTKTHTVHSSYAPYVVDMSCNEAKIIQMCVMFGEVGGSIHWLLPSLSECLKNIIMYYCWVNECLQDTRLYELFTVKHKGF